MLDLAQHQVAVVQVAEDRLQALGGFAGDLRLLAEAGTDDLQHVAQSLRRDPHVVLGVAASGARASAAKPRSSSRRTRTIRETLGDSGALRIETVHLSRFHEPRRLDELPQAAAQLLQPLRGDVRRKLLVGLPLQSRTSSISVARALRSASAAASTRPSSSAISTSRSRRSPSASASAFTLFSALRCRLAESRTRRSRAPRVAGASPPACRGRARLRPSREPRWSARRPRRREPRPLSPRLPRTTPHSRARPCAHAPRAGG